MKKIANWNKSFAFTFCFQHLIDRDKKINKQINNKFLNFCQEKSSYNGNIKILLTVSKTMKIIIIVIIWEKC